MKSSKMVVMILLIIVLSVLCTLFATGTIKLDNLKKIETKEDSFEKKDTKFSEKEAISKGTTLYDKANEIYSVWKLLPYCGYNLEDTYNQDGISLDTTNSDAKFYPSKYNSVDELKKDLSKYLSDDIIEKNVVENGDVLFYKVYNGKLYCRKTLGNGWFSTYLNKYDIKVLSIEKNKITYNITSYYAKDYTKCNSSGKLSISSCEKSNIETKETNFAIEKINNNWVVTDFTLHD